MKGKDWNGFEMEIVPPTSIPWSYTDVGKWRVITNPFGEIIGIEGTEFTTVAELQKRYPNLIKSSPQPIKE